MSLIKKENEIYINRIYNASLEQVWDAWVAPHKVAKWWGPRGFTLTTKRKDVRTGGDWLYTMHGPDGTDYPNHTKFLEVDRHKLLIYDHGGFEDKPPMFRVTVIFNELNNKTKMEMTMALPTAEAAHETKKIIKKAAGDTTWDRLAEFLEKESTQKDIFVINRIFNESVDTVFDHWINPKHIMNWLPPSGFTGKYIKDDIRQNGEVFYQMANENFNMYGKAKYLQISKPSKIVYTQIFTDEKGNTSRHPLAPNWPEMMKVTINFFMEDESQTLVTLKTETWGNVTEDEQKLFNDSRSGMTQGWTGSFDKLDKYLIEKSEN